MTSSNEINYIDTSVISENVAEALANKQESKNYKALLESHSYAVQFAVKTHDDSFSVSQKNEFAGLKYKAECQAREVLREIHGFHDKDIKSTLKLGIIIGSVAGVLVTAIISYIW